MRQTKPQKDPSKALMTNIKGVMEITGLGKVSATKIGKESGAIVKVGRLNYYKVDVIKDYINNL